jgi:hypothetical protein
MGAVYRFSHVGGLPTWRTVPAVLVAVALTFGDLACTSSQPDGHTSSVSPSGNGPNVPTGAEATNPNAPTEPGGVQRSVSAISPSAGTADVLVVITGQALGGVTAVCFGRVPGSHLTVRANDQITVRSPSGSGSVRVTLIVHRNSSVVIPAGTFTYLGSAAPGSPSPVASPPCPASPSSVPAP